MLAIFYVFMFIFGAIFGSFLCCSARRLRLKEQGKPPLGPRSVCPFCKTKLKWYENLPLISWVIQKGRCRHCHKKIGALEILSELGSAAAFLALAIHFRGIITSPAPLSIALFAVTLIFVISLLFLAIYDGAYGELPTFALTISLICAIMVAILRIWSLFFAYPINPANPAAPHFSWQPIFDAAFSALILGGLYLALYLGSKGKWVGSGDWLLALSIGLALGKPFTALVALFIANFAATLIMFPTVKKTKNHQIYFGPFLVLAYIICVIINI